MQSKTLPDQQAPPNPQERPPLEVVPARWWTLGVWAVFWIAVARFFYLEANGFLNWYTSIVWSLSLFVALIGFYGVGIGQKIIKAQPGPGVAVLCHQRVNVIVTTKGSYDVLGALSRVVESLPSMRAHFSRAYFYILTDANCEAMDAIEILAAKIGAKVVVVPRSYVPSKLTRFKGRAQHYFTSEFLVARPGGADAIPWHEWNYWLDDDTAIARCTARIYAAFADANIFGMPGCRHFAQGILTYRLQDAHNWFLWLADAIRTFDDFGRFVATTASGTPRAGLHGENAFVRARIDVEVGWDFGPNELVEDSRRALEFCRLYPGRSAWVPARVFGAPPITPTDFAQTQRGRWADGMASLARNRDIPLKYRWLIIHNMIVWGTGIFQPAAIVLLVSFLVNDLNVSPVTPWLVPVWVISVSYTYWAYWEGLRQNALASGLKTAPLLHKIVMIFPGIFVFSILEGYGGTYGAVRSLLRRKKTEVTFDLVSKPV